MPVDGGGNIQRPGSPIPVTGQGADAPQVNVPINDIYSIMNMFPFLDGRKSWIGNQNLNGYKFTNALNGSDPQDYVTVSQMQAAIAAVSFIFPGFQMIDTITSTVAPQGWLYANGQEVVRATYPALWARVQAGNNLAATQGTKTHGQYGPGNGTTTFTLPNMYGASTLDGGYFIRAVSSGRAIGTVQADNFASHGHALNMNAVPAHTHRYGDFETAGSVGPDVAAGPAYGRRDVNRTTEPGGGHTPSGTAVATGGTETRPKNIAYPVLIKT